MTRTMLKSPLETPGSPVVRFVLGLAFMLLLPLNVGLAQQLTPEQMRQLQSLSPEEREQLREQFQNQAGTSGPEVRQKPPEQPQVVEPQRAEPSERARRSGDTAQSQTARRLAGNTLGGNNTRIGAFDRGLERFGYDLFAGRPTTFAPATEIPVPADYVIGPGDTIQINYYGKESGTYELAVNRRGEISIPEIGPVNVAGLKYEAMRELLQQRIREQRIGIKATITLGALRSIRVFVLGDARTPGSYTVSGLSTLTNALFVSGGIKPMGSLRDIQLKRNGRRVTSLDLYDLLLEGDTRGDARLQPGDAILVPPVGPTVGVAGAVRRPAIYEFKQRGAMTADQAAELAGGLRSSAYPEAAKVERIRREGDRRVIDVDLTTQAGRNFRLQDGDRLHIPSTLDAVEEVVFLQGHLERPGTREWHPGMRLLDIVPSAEVLRPRPDLNYVVIQREVPPTRRIKVLTVDLDQAFDNPASEANLELQPRDRIRIFGVDEDRAALLQSTVNTLQRQARLGDPARVVEIKGHVRHPGAYPLTPNMQLSDLITAAVDVRPNVDRDYALLVREQPDERGLTIRSFQLEALLSPGPTDQDLALQPRDDVIIFQARRDRSPLLEPLLQRIRQYARQGKPEQIVRIGGSIAFPGDYPLERDMTVRDLLEAAGGLSQDAYTLTGELVRFRVVDSEKREVSRSVLDLASILDQEVTADGGTELRPFDVVQIKQVPRWRDRIEVSLEGEVRFPGNYTVEPGTQLDEVIRRAGGLTESAFPAGAVFSRESLREREQAQIARLRERLRSDLAAISLESLQDEEEGQEAVSTAQGLLNALETIEAKGRMVIDLPRLLAGDDTANVRLRDDDRIRVPPIPDSVSIIGEVNHSTSHLYDETLTRQDYIQMSGGLTARADERRIYIVRADGRVVTGGGTRWFQRSRQTVRRGDTIVAPLDVDRMRPITLAQTIAEVLGDFGLAVAAFSSVGAF